MAGQVREGAVAHLQEKVEGCQSRIDAASVDMGQAHGRLHAGGARGKASSAVALAREDDSCAICLGALQKPRTLSCGHQFCAGCLDSADASELSRSCALCRAPIEAPKPRRRLLSSLFGSRSEGGGDGSFVRCTVIGADPELFLYTS